VKSSSLNIHTFSKDDFHTLEQLARVTWDIPGCRSAWNRSQVDFHK